MEIEKFRRTPLVSLNMRINAAVIKGVPITGHEDPRGCGCKSPHIHTMALERVASPTLGRL